MYIFLIIITIHNGVIIISVFLIIKIVVILNTFAKEIFNLLKFL